MYVFWIVKPLFAVPDRLAFKINFCVWVWMISSEEETPKMHFKNYLINVAQN